MKLCASCGESKPKADFYKHPKAADGLQGKCKECAKAASRQNRANNVERYRKYDVHRYQTQPSRRASAAKCAASPAGAASKKRWADRNPLKRKAHIAVKNAIRDGKLKKPDQCGSCGARGRIEAHHADYEKPLAVEWLCVSCHKERHTHE